MKFNAFRVGLVGTLGVGAGLLILTSIVNLSTVLTYIGAAMFLALGLDPAIVWLESRRVPRRWAIFVVLALVVLVFAGIVWAVIPIVVSEVTKFIGAIPRIVDVVSTQEWLNALQQQMPWLDVQKVIDSVEKSLTDFISDPTAISSLAGGVFGAIVSIGTGVFAVIIVVILTMYFTASLTHIKNGAYQLVPLSQRDRFAHITDQITESVGKFVVGQISLAAINGVASFIFLSIISAPFPALLAFIAFGLSLVPLVGTLTGSVLIVLVCLIPGIGSPLTALVAAIYYVVYMQVEAYVLSPHIMNRAVQVPGSLVVIAALAGGALMGVLGALIAIPAAAAALLIIKQVVIPRQNER